MRTTITLDERLMAKLKRRAAEQGTSVSKLVEQAARLFVLVNVSIHDALQTTHASKFVYGVWRPVTAIRAADTDLNAGTDYHVGADPHALLDEGRSATGFEQPRRYAASAERIESLQQIDEQLVRALIDDGHGARWHVGKELGMDDDSAGAGLG